MNNYKPVSNIKVGDLVRATHVVVEYEGHVTKINNHGCVQLKGFKWFDPSLNNGWTLEVLSEPVETLEAMAMEFFRVDSVREFGR